MTNTNGTNGTPSNGATNGASNGGTNTNGGQSNTSNSEPPAIGNELPITGNIRYYPKENMHLQADKLTTGWGGNPNRVDILLRNGHSEFGEEETIDASLQELERKLGDAERVADLADMRDRLDRAVGLQ
ncbi:hypothetical protein J4E89_002528 [Alternaria sp. Ai002NY15]|nr:hypothetical protein J4E89_002528 [Alternaria sp. Ai002NY15]